MDEDREDIEDVELDEERDGSPAAIVNPSQGPAELSALQTYAQIPTPDAASSTITEAVLP